MVEATLLDEFENLRKYYYTETKEECNRYHLVAMVFTKKGNYIQRVSIGYNKSWTYVPIHAEVSAFKSIATYKKLPKKLNLVVYKFTKKGKLTPSMPCSDCRTYMEKYCKEHGITLNKVYYIEKDGCIKNMKFEEMLRTPKFTCGYRKRHI